MLIKEALIMGKESLKLHNLPSYQLDAQVLLSEVTGLKRSELLTKDDQPLTADQEQVYRCLLDRRSWGEPVAYLIGYKEFMGLDFKVTPAVLIPRPDTELMVETAIQFLQQGEQDNQRAVDVGTGSGAIAISLANLVPQLQVLAMDLSGDALEIAKENSIMHQVSDRVQFLQGNLLQGVDPSWQGKVSVITANLPYIPSGDIEGLMADVKDYEPRLALDGGFDGLDLYRQLLPQAYALLKDGGMLLMEISPGQGQSSLVMTPKDQWNTVIAHDLAGRERLVIATKKLD